MSATFKPRYFKDPGGTLPPGFWIGVVIIVLLLIWLRGCKGGVYL